MSITPFQFTPRTADRGRAALESLGGAPAFDLVPQGRRSGERIYLDTFDWRLWSAGTILLAETLDSGIVLRWTGRDGAPKRTLRVDELPSFAWRLPPGPLRDELAPLLDVRRLLPVLTVTTESEPLTVLGPGEKIVARVELRTARVAVDADSPECEMPYRLVVRPLRGYEREARQVAERLEQRLGPAANAGDELSVALRALGRTPGGSSGKPQVRMTPMSGSAGVVQRILASLLATVRANEDGLRRDLDPEFLHDYRVAVRRARTCCGQLRGVLPQRAVRRVREDLAWLGSLTGPCRDLDVYLLRLGAYRAALPELARDDLAPLREHLRERKRRERETLLSAMDSERYREALEHWQTLTTITIAADAAADAATTIGHLAAERIARRFARMIERGSAIGDQSPDADLHRLRIDAKKLRYLLEFFAPILDPDAHGALVRRLKRLQDTLGEFNDYCVQQASLVEFADQMAQGGLERAAPLLAIGRLLSQLETRQVDTRRQFASRFAKFAAKSNTERLRRMVARTAEAGGDAP